MIFLNKFPRVSIFTGSRAEYGLLYWVIKELISREIFDINVVATGTHLSKKMGHTVTEIRNDFPDLIHEIDIGLEGTSPHHISAMMGKGIQEFSNYFSSSGTDLIIILGDRFEILSVAVAALPYNIPIAHIGGGEISEGVIDDSIRHCLTKLSHIHFPITKKCGERIKSLGENPSNVHVVGSTSLDILRKIRFLSKSQLSDMVGFNKEKRLMLFVYHPVTLEYRKTPEQIENILSVINNFDFEIIMIYPNIDTSSNHVIERLDLFSKENTNVFLIKNMDRKNYLSLMNIADIMVGNSSSGIVESPSFNLPVVNIGNRQAGRDKSKNIIDCSNSVNSITEAINKVNNDEKFIQEIKEIRNPNGDGFASRRIADILSEIDFNSFNIKKDSKFINS